jgi:hypothetical protein
MSPNAAPLQPYSAVVFARLGIALSFRFVDGWWRRRAQMFVNDSQPATVIALKNLRRAPEERVALLAFPVFARLAGMKSVGVGSNRYIRTCNLHFDGIQLGAGGPIPTDELAHPPHRRQCSPLASLGLARKNERRRRIQILKPLLQSAAQNIPELLHSGADLGG